jgi:hypothetical protein
MIQEHIAKDLDFEGLTKTIPTITKWGNKEFLESLKIPCTSEKDIKRKQIPIMYFFLSKTKRDLLRQSLSNIEIVSIDDIIENNDLRVEENITQIFWKPESIGKFLNTNSVYLNFIIFWKTLFLPLISILMPLVALIVPWVFLKLNNPSMLMNDYMERIRKAILQQITIPVILRSRSSNDIIGFLIERLFIGITLTTFISSIWNQVAPAIHLRTIWFQIEKQGLETMKLIQWLKSFPSEFKHIQLMIQSVLHKIGHLEYESPVAVYAYFREHRDELLEIIKIIGYIDVILAISSLDSICFPKFQTNTMTITDLHHPLVSNCIKNTIKNIKNHVILTGPNRGGKSTFMKSYALSVILAHTWGFCYARQATMPWFNSFHIALTPSPILGQTSTFEAEIDYARSICEFDKGSQFVMMDEIFHSTNAIDGTAATKIFLNRLYSKNNSITSVISTHYHDIPNIYKNIEKLMMETLEQNGILHHTYKLKQGINTHSTVLDILKERKLVRSDL